MSKYFQNNLMTSFHAVYAKIGDVLIKISCYWEEVYRFLKESLNIDSDLFRSFPDIHIVIKNASESHNEKFPLYEEGCFPIEGHFKPPFPSEEEFVQVYRYGGSLVYRRGLNPPTTLGIWRYGQQHGEVIAVSKEPHIEEIRVACFAILREALKEYGYFPLHAAALAKGDQTVLIPAHGGTGKSALSLALMERGFSFISDDTVLLHEREKSVYAAGFLEKPRIGKSHLSLFPEVEFLKEEPELPAIPKWHVSFQDIFSKPNQQIGKPSIVLFLLKDQPSSLSRLTRPSMMQYLGKHVSYLNSHTEIKQAYSLILMNLSETTKGFTAGRASPQTLARVVETLLGEE